MIDAKGSWLLQPWIRLGAKIYPTIEEVPEDHILISVHFPPWRSPYKEWIAKERKHIEIDYGYWGINNPRRNTRRVTYGGSHNLNMKVPPYSRLDTFNPHIAPWQNKRGDHLLIIEPQPSIFLERTGCSIIEWHKKIKDSLNDVWDGPIKIRRKSGGKNPGRWPSFLEDLKISHAVLGERTMACVEAVMLGWPAYTVDFSAVSLLMGTNISLISNPDFPDRTSWLDHIAWSQFNQEEFLSGKVAELVEIYQINF